ncbi:hypothetical protein HYH03_003286 [Edaphochlamys debaryana]|uniref:monodehydroascorbate reductase (NADH) n=1 Tax=Edaphochlamys debaryana TaxID=47281 RepID=A0A835YD67_9CHLO|nr:hypothetical protein HYH03_003286 [Edaphochlamys debaryana]|eukprot:KAG2499103.1 hypothetical protein HYH03_003286 [Edaphochlamys debaryana]
MTVVVLGGGNAAGYAAREYVASGGKPGELKIIGEEGVVSYERPALSKGFLLGAAKLPGFHTCVGGGGERQEPSWYADKGIEFRTGAKVTAADLKAKKLTLEGGEVVSFSKLIIATGARVVKLTEFKVPGADLSGIHYLRNVKDGEAMLAAMAQAKEHGQKVVVVGGGYIGMECAAGLVSSGIKSVTMVFPEPGLLGRLLTPELAGVYERLYQEKGVTCVKGAKVTGFTGADGKVAGVQYTDASGATHTAEASLVVVGVGARANAELFAGQVEMAAGGIKVDGQMATSVPDVYAVGDVAAFPLKSVATGEVAHARQEHVTHCRMSAAQAIKAALGLAPPPYDYLPYFYSRIFNLAWVFYGEAAPGATVVHFGDTKEAKCFGALWVSADGHLVGAFLEGGSPEDPAVLKAAVASKAKVDAAKLDASSGAAVIAALKAAH